MYEYVIFWHVLMRVLHAGSMVWEFISNKLVAGHGAILEFAPFYLWCQVIYVTWTSESESQVTLMTLT